MAFIPDSTVHSPTFGLTTRADQRRQWGEEATTDRIFNPGRLNGFLRLDTGAVWGWMFEQTVVMSPLDRARITAGEIQGFGRLPDGQKVYTLVKLAPGAGLFTAGEDKVAISPDGARSIGWPVPDLGPAQPVGPGVAVLIEQRGQEAAEQNPYDPVGAVVDFFADDDFGYSDAYSDVGSYAKKGAKAAGKAVGAAAGFGAEIVALLLGDVAGRVVGHVIPLAIVGGVVWLIAREVGK